MAYSPIFHENGQGGSGSYNERSRSIIRMVGLGIGTPTLSLRTGEASSTKLAPPILGCHKTGLWDRADQGVAYQRTPSGLPQTSQDE